MGENAQFYLEKNEEFSKIHINICSKEHKEIKHEEWIKTHPEKPAEKKENKKADIPQVEVAPIKVEEKLVEKKIDLPVKVEKVEEKKAEPQTVPTEEKKVEEPKPEVVVVQEQAQEAK